MTSRQFDMVVVGGTPGGIMAAVAAAREGRSALVLERTSHIGGLPANGLGATDIATRGATTGLFREYVDRVRSHYVETYGEDSQQVRDCSDGYRFEPRVAARVFEDMIRECGDSVTVALRRQFDADPANVKLVDGAIRQITVTDRDSGESEQCAAEVFVDATYEGDLAAAAGAQYRLGREGADEYGEPMAGQLYKAWRGDVGAGSTGLADNAVQSYNYRLCLTRDPSNRVPIDRPDGYSRDEYASLVDDVRDDRFAGKPGREMASDGIGRIVNMVALPNGKTDANNQHMAFLSTDLPEENWPWPTADWHWRDAFARRQRDYTLGLLWFVQNDPGLPGDFRDRCSEWGLAADEYEDNGSFPRQVYVREGRRIEGEHLFTAHDAIPVAEGARPPIHRSSVTSSHYALDSHAVRKREPGRVHLDGFFSHGSMPYTAPYEVMLPKGVDGLLTPVPVSGTHVGFSTLRMEPCWMALGEAAGVAASIAIESRARLRDVCRERVQQRLLARGATLVYYRDANPGDVGFGGLQFFTLRGFLGGGAWTARLGEPVNTEDAANWMAWAGATSLNGRTLGETTRGELLDMLYDHVMTLPLDALRDIQAR